MEVRTAIVSRMCSTVHRSAADRIDRHIRSVTSMLVKPAAAHMVR